jgi:alkanesulfonate monooxygenase SsuD/methylene tetrahydromethanopterin reductase-like flavin-dependent oxidoreductase (luciferase family)
MDREAATAVAAHISRHRFTYRDERDLQEGIAELLGGEHHVEREVRLNAADRVDLLVDGSLCIETKIAGSPQAVRRQLERYAAHPDIAAILLVTSRVRHDVPHEMNGKPVIVAMLGHHF